MVSTSRKHLQRVVVGFLVLVLLGSAAVTAAAKPSAGDLKAIDRLVQQHGTKPFVKMILAERSGRITLEAGGRLKTGYGPPNQRYVTALSIAYDLQAMGATVDDLPALLAPYVATRSGGAGTNDGFVVSNGNLASLAARGKVNVANEVSSAPSSRDEGDRLQNEIGELEDRVRVMEEELNEMLAAREDRDLIQAQSQKIAELRSEINRKKEEVRKRRAEELEAKRAALKGAEGAGGGDAAPPGDGDDDSKKAYWVGRYKTATAAVERARSELEALDRKYLELERAFWSWGGDGVDWDTRPHDAERPRETPTMGYEAQALKKEMAQVDTKRRLKRQELAAAEKRLAEMKEEARRAGALPGWFRNLD